MTKTIEQKKKTNIRRLLEEEKKWKSLETNFGHIIRQNVSTQVLCFPKKKKNRGFCLRVDET